MPLAGVDLVPGPGGEGYRVLEINDRPNGWSRLNPLCRRIQRLAERQDRSRIYVVAPPAISTGGATIPIPTRPHRDWRRRDLRIEQLIADLTALDSAGGAEVLFGDVAAAREDLRSSRRTLYLDKSASLDPQALLATSNGAVNSLHFRAACEDKLSAKGMLRSNGIPVPESPSSSSRYASRVIPIVEKPRFGSAGIGVHFHYGGAGESLQPRVGNFLEEWCEPFRVVRQGWQYYADMRIYICDDRPCGAFLRVAAAPLDESSGIQSQSALLTSAGQWVPASQFLPSSSIRFAEGLALEAVRTIDKESTGQLLNYCPFPARREPIESAAIIEADVGQAPFAVAIN